ncbi:hypothetical protein [Francisella sp. TX07-6608]|uniref:hypothetical protein n=1 Tax=Francisella sp. TX07-6608 TaxID=573568 RepID=UPI0008F9B94F|nr:hypothetical protein [Francisella sp. TX07-6608]OIN83995.1 hypothetical protein KX00_151 [Francisella sp. TX07-6608]
MVSYANTDWNKLFDVSNTINESKFDNPIYQIKEYIDDNFENKKYDNNMLLLKASENIRKREAWSIKNAQYSYQDPKYSFQRFKKELEGKKPQIKNKNWQESLEETNKFLNDNAVIQKIQLTADNAYISAVRISKNYYLCTKANLNYDELAIEANRSLSWVPSGKHMKETLINRQRADSINHYRNNRSIEKGKLANFKVREV